jgi:hypothetical protein
MNAETIVNDLMTQWFLLHNINLDIIDTQIQIKYFFEQICLKHMKIIESGLPIFDIILKYTKLEYLTDIIKENLKHF